MRCCVSFSTNESAHLTSDMPALTVASFLCHASHFFLYNSPVLTEQGMISTTAEQNIKIGSLPVQQTTSVTDISYSVLLVKEALMSFCRGGLQVSVWQNR